MTVVWTLEDLYEMGFFRNEVTKLISTAAKLNLSPILLGEFVMKERFKIWMSEVGDEQASIRELIGPEVKK